MDSININIKDKIVRSDDKTGKISQKKKQELQKIKKACQDFESIFTYTMLKTMRQTVPQVKGPNSFPGKETYNMIMDQKVAEEISRKGNGLGLQKVLYDQMTKNYAKDIVQEEVIKKD
ncbi:MAG TPA: rod-binding protein [Smithellaceae bacterium]|nr:rod-binding protein [Smithellaceae bacterium]